MSWRKKPIVLLLRLLADVVLTSRLEYMSVGRRAARAAAILALEKHCSDKSDPSDRIDVTRFEKSFIREYIALVGVGRKYYSALPPTGTSTALEVASYEHEECSTLTRILSALSAMQKLEVHSVEAALEDLEASMRAHGESS